MLKLVDNRILFVKIVNPSEEAKLFHNPMLASLLSMHGIHAEILNKHKKDVHSQCQVKSQVLKLPTPKMSLKPAVKGKNGSSIS